MKTSTLVASALVAGMLSVGAPAMAADKAAFEAAHSAADAERKKARKVGMEWRDTKKMLKKAQELAAEGKFDAAIKLADKAKAQGIAGQRQAKVQAETWQAAVIR